MSYLSQYLYSIVSSYSAYGAQSPWWYSPMSPYTPNWPVQGTDGNDTFFGDNSKTVYNGKSGIDTISYVNSPEGVTVYLWWSKLGEGGYADGDSLSSIENVVASNYDDLIFASSDANHIDGLLGNDTLSYEYSNAGVKVDIGSPLARYSSNTGFGSGGHAAGDTYANINNVKGSILDDHLKGNNLDNRLEGLGGRDVLNGYEGNDTLIGGENDDVLLGHLGNDTLIGGAGADEMWGDSLAEIFGYLSNIYTDTVDYSESPAAVTIEFDAESEGKHDQPYRTGKGGDAQGDILYGIERIIGSNFDDNISGTDDDDYLYGMHGDDWLAPGKGINLVYGGFGTDKLFLSGQSNDYSIDNGPFALRVNSLSYDTQIIAIGIETIAFENGTEAPIDYW